LSKLEVSKRTISVAVVVVVIVVIVAGAWLWSSNYFRGGRSSTGDKIEIVECSADCGPCTTCVVAVRNVGSAAVEITAIYVGADLYTYSASASPGKFSAVSPQLTNQIAPGQTVAFTVTKASGSWNPSATYTVKAVTKNGAEASVSC
jgi:hypothetical protein